MLDVADPPRNQVHVAVEDRLASGLTHIDPDVESAHFGVLVLDAVPPLVQQLSDRVAL